MKQNEEKIQLFSVFFSSWNRMKCWMISWHGNSTFFSGGINSFVDFFHAQRLHHFNSIKSIIFSLSAGVYVLYIELMLMLCSVVNGFAT